MSATHGSGTEGTFCLVLHSHLPWLAHHGVWPVGEEWLYQAWAHSYLPVLELLHRFAREGKRDLLTLGMTPVLSAQLDDPYTLRSFQDWLGHWQLRAEHAASLWRGKPLLDELAAAEHRQAQHAFQLWDTRWRHGLSPVLRPLVESQVVELLGGPLTHPFQPLLHEPVRKFALRGGLDDIQLRTGQRPAGLWAPECGYAPGMEQDYAAAGIQHFLVDGPSLRGDTASARTVGSSDVVCFGRDLDVTYRVWSPKAGYPGHSAYRDFHTWQHEVGIKASRVTGKDIAPDDKEPYDPARAADAVQTHVKDFVDTVVTRLRQLRAQQGQRSLVVAAYDTELFGHWWHEGPAWLEGVLRALPEAGVHVTTLRGALDAGHLGGSVHLPASSWGSGKDWRVWDGAQVSDLVHANDDLQHRMREVQLRSSVRDPVLDQAITEGLLALSSDWAFMVTKDSAADYARNRARVHRERFAELVDLWERDPSAASDRAAHFRMLAAPFGQLDARGLLGANS